MFLGLSVFAALSLNVEPNEVVEAPTQTTEVATTEQEPQDGGSDTPTESTEPTEPVADDPPVADGPTDVGAHRGDGSGRGRGDGSGGGAGRLREEPPNIEASSPATTSSIATATASTATDEDADAPAKVERQHGGGREGDGAGSGKGRGDGTGRGIGGGAQDGTSGGQTQYGGRPVDGSGTAAEAQPPRSLEFSPGKGLVLSSPDAKHQLKVGLFTHVLYRVAHDEATDETTQLFTVRRARLKLGGYAFGVHNKFFMHLAFAPRDLQIREGHPTRSPIFDWYLDFDYIRDFTVRVGQYRVPYSRQRRIPIGKVMMADRSLANFEFNLDRDVGVSVRSPDIAGLGFLRYDAGVFIGEGRDAFAADGFGMLYVARVEALPLGMFGDYSETDRKRGKKPRLSLGAAYAYLAEAKGNRGVLGANPTDGGTTDYHNVTADALFKIWGLTALAEFYWRQGRRDYGTTTTTDDQGVVVPTPLEAARNGWGWFAQAGFMVPKVDLELGARYGFVRELNTSSLPDRDEVAASVGYYIYGRALKVVADYTHGIARDGSDLRTHQGRVQIQAAF